MKIFSIFVFAIMFTASAYALTLKEKKEFAYWNEEAVEVIAYVNEECGTEMSLSLDENFVAPFMEANATAAGYCENALGAVSTLCDSDEFSKTAIKDAVKDVQCMYNPTDKDITHSLSNGIFTINIGLDATNIEDKTKDFLENNL